MTRITQCCPPITWVCFLASWLQKLEPYESGDRPQNTAPP
eukprot:CAMPEP_0173439440 /NCGR_PEP_ID=MMETSP1357-20121228/20960_1 /TAXON_ID=77926 /ORGANISM="Hemiselmis rufescens, Strain PCC563" /LENGTH=39 /DNA_ID= /DNA_START= /DNA_END= /DNA_ORIENTATION=